MTDAYVVKRLYDHVRNGNFVRVVEVIAVEGDRVKVMARTNAWPGTYYVSPGVAGHELRART